jgi:hypothetical protein
MCTWGFGRACSLATSAARSDERVPPRGRLPNQTATWRKLSSFPETALSAKNQRAPMISHPITVGKEKNVASAHQESGPRVNHPGWKHRPRWRFGPSRTCTDRYAAARRVDERSELSSHCAPLAIYVKCGALPVHSNFQFQETETRKLIYQPKTPASRVGEQAAPVDLPSLLDRRLAS